MTYEDLLALAQKTSDEAKLKKRMRFHYRYGHYYKCAVCGGYLGSPRKMYSYPLTSECPCRGPKHNHEVVESGYTLDGKLELFEGEPDEGEW